MCVQCFHYFMNYISVLFLYYCLSYLCVKKDYVIFVCLLFLIMWHWLLHFGGSWQFIISPPISKLMHLFVPTSSYSAKGRTNIELREQFILAEGVSQSMSAFKPKHSPSSAQRSLSLSSNAGPITKVTI